MKQGWFKRIFNHPWMVAIGSGIVLLIIQEITPLKLIKNYIWPVIINTCLRFYNFLLIEHSVKTIWLILVCFSGPVLYILAVRFFKPSTIREITKKDYTEDTFFEVKWCWKSLPQHGGDMYIKDITPLCPNCSCELDYSIYGRVSFKCTHCKFWLNKGEEYFEITKKVEKEILRNIRTGDYKKVVEKQRKAN